MLIAHGPDIGLGAILAFYSLFVLPTLICIWPIVATVRSGRRRFGILAMLNVVWPAWLGGAAFLSGASAAPGVTFLTVVAMGAWVASIVVLARYPARLPAAGHCACGYDLTGNASGRCPECGLSLPPAEA